MSAAETARGTGGAAERPVLLAFLAEEADEAALRGGLAEWMDAVPVRRGNVRTAARALEREETPRLLIVDISGVDDAAEALDRLATVCSPDVRVLVVGDRNDLSFYRGITRDLGVEEYIYKPLTRDNVSRLFGPPLAELLSAGGSHGPATPRGGQIVAVSGLRGGVGATTIATNLALHLSETTRGHVALLDLHLRGGSAALSLGARPGAGLRVALEEPDRVDALFLDRVSIPVSDRFRVVAADEALESSPAPTEAGITRLLELLRSRFNTIVVDLPHPPGVMERRVIALARHRILVMGPDVASIRDAGAGRRMVAALASGATPLLVLNRAGLRGGLGNALVAEGLGSAPDILIPDFPGQVPKAMNLGRPALHDSAGFRRALTPLTREISGAGAAAEEGGLRRLARLWRR
ncbi:AAA family ATPase [Teichococcus aestuarii]|uniref:Pilus assembly protein CpaE n=1 Tax=Teichococcus aestuarii TaxID=568898 RepID=A0A2U1V106_9PROT|nr:pilus assembly protein CpaE [Pseudoroseomonas aestuarii]PWC27573.1 pilus assembly protein CpaE [Pseudoroseomonas aestuarii]